MLFFWLIVLLAVRENLSLREGEQCFTRRFQGICRHYEKCPSVYKQLVSGQPPDLVCSYSGFEPIVCCPRYTQDLQRPPPNIIRPSNPIITVPGQPMQQQNRAPGQRAAEKCAEYSNSVYELVGPPILTQNPDPVRVSTCAQDSFRRFIVGGMKAAPKSFPHMAAVGYNDRRQGILWLCGGTLISDQFVLTAAHCLYASGRGGAAWVRLGDLNLKRNDDDARPRNVRVIERIKHPNYRNPSLYHDIALLRLERSVNFDAYVRPACLPYIATNTDPGSAVATGWGRIDWTDEEGSEDLMEVTLITVPTDQCSQFYKDDGHRLNRGIVPNWQICAGEEGKDTCQGDSGGPLVVSNNNYKCMYNVIGITSIGKICGSIVPGVYTRVSNYISWIENIVWPE